MHRSVLLFTWLLMATLHTYQCHGTDCRPIVRATVGPKRLTMFATQLECEDYRHALAEQTPPPMHSRTRPDVTIRKEILYTCQPGAPL